MINFEVLNENVLHGIYKKYIDTYLTFRQFDMIDDVKNYIFTLLLEEEEDMINLKYDLENGHFYELFSIKMISVMIREPVDYTLYGLSKNLDDHLTHLVLEYFKNYLNRNYTIHDEFKIEPMNKELNLFIKQKMKDYQQYINMDTIKNMALNYLKTKNEYLTNV